MAMLSINKSQRLLSLVLAILLSLMNAGQSQAVVGQIQGMNDSYHTPEGPVVMAQIIVGPFDLHRRYKSMEGPFVQPKFRVSDLLASQTVTIPESMVRYIERGGTGSMSMMGGSGGSEVPVTEGLKDTSDAKRELYWLKRVSIDVLDENDKPLPTAEFICHNNIQVDMNFRNRVFPLYAERCNEGRLITLTQGQTDFSFPDGFGVPVASDEFWDFNFQAANRTTDMHRRIKHRLRMWLIKDSALVYPIKALHWYVPTICVQVDGPTQSGKQGEQHMDCSLPSRGVSAPNRGTAFVDVHGRWLVGHWVVPPGPQVYRAPITDDRDPGFAAVGRTIHAAWTHVHPLCKSMTLYECKGRLRQAIFTVNVNTDTEHGLQLTHIDNISSTDGIAMPKGKNYLLEAVYDNTTGIPMDAMATSGIFFEDQKFARPDWAVPQTNPADCGVSPAKAQPATP